MIREPLCFEVGQAYIGGWRYSDAIKKIDVELIVVADEAEEVVAELTPSSIGLEERPALFGGGSRPSRSITREHGRDRHSRIRWPLVRRSLLLSGLHVRAWLLPYGSHRM